LSNKKILKNFDFQEYCGEIISKAETEKRNQVYLESKCSYVFNLTKEHDIDANRKGNNVRFVNDSRDPNCIPKIVNVKGEYRMCFFALRDIEPNEELFIDYNYDGDHQKHFLKRTN
jgi:SET domain-containing protein